MDRKVVYTSEKSPSIVEVLNETSLQLLEIREEYEIYKILASALSKILPGAYCLVSKLQPDQKNFRIVQMHGVERLLPAAKLILGKDPLEWDFPFDELLKNHREAFESRKLYRFQEGIYGISAGTISRTVSNTLEKLAGKSDLYTTCFYMDNTYYGGLNILVPKKVMKSGIMNQEAILAIETLSNLTTVLIHKLQANEALDANRKVLETMISEKDKVYSIIAHDLKSPFNSIIGFTEVLSDENITISEENRVLYTSLLHDSAISTYKLLENLLEWSRLHLSNYDIQKETILVSFVVNDCIALYRANALNKNITVRNLVSEETRMYVDCHSIHTILRNLLNNALKYTSKEGNITFSSNRRDDFVELSVKDTGMGIHPEMLQKLFVVGENTSTPGTNMEKGTGIGLLLCRDLIEKNDGYIRVESTPGEGSTFTVGLPTRTTQEVLL